MVGWSCGTAWPGFAAGGGAAPTNGAALVGAGGAGIGVGLGTGVAVEQAANNPPTQAISAGYKNRRRVDVLGTINPSPAGVVYAERGTLSALMEAARLERTPA